MNNLLDILKRFLNTGADLDFLIWGGLNAEVFLSALRKCQVKNISHKILIKYALNQQSLTQECEFPVNFANFFSNTFFTEHLWTTASIFSSKYLFYRVSSLPVKKSSFSKISGLEPATLMKTKHFRRHILICLALMQNWCSYFIEDLSVATSKSIKTFCST